MPHSSFFETPASFQLSIEERLFGKTIVHLADSRCSTGRDPSYKSDPVVVRVAPAEAR
jgi:hypothetical protein